MKTILFLLAGASALATAAPAEAQTRPGFEAGVQLFDYGYRERVDGQTVARDDGKFIGITGSYVETIGGGWFLRASAATASGSVDYSSEDGRIEDVSQYVAQVEFHIGHDFQLGDGGTLALFTGIGGRSLEDNSGGEETEQGLLGYNREIGYSYLPAGVAASLPVGGRMNLILSAQYNLVVGGTAKSKFSDIDPEFPDISLDLDGGHGIEAGAMLAVPLGGSALRFGPFVRHWSLERSKSKFFEEEDLEVELFEPANRSTEVGLRVAFAF